MKAKRPKRPMGAADVVRQNGDGSAPARRAGAAPGRTPKVRRPAAAGSPYSDTPNLVVAAEGHDRLRTFSEALRVAGLEQMLSEKGPFTIFAPTNRAFSKLSRDEYRELLADSDRLARLLCHHVVPGRVRAPKPDAPRLAMPIDGAELTLSARADRYQVDEASIVRTNIRASNGVIHAIDTVLLAV